MMSHRVKVYMKPLWYGGGQGIKVNDTYLQFDVNGSELYLDIYKPSQQESDSMEIFELTLPLPEESSSVLRSRKRLMP